MKKTLILILSISLIAIGSLFALNKLSPSKKTQQQNYLKVGMELAYPPFESKDEAGQPYGVSVELAHELGKYLNKEVIIENIAWDGLIPSLQTGKIDLIISSMTITDKRQEVVNFSQPYAHSLLAVLTNKNSNLNSITDLNSTGKKIAVKTGSTGYFYALENLQNAEIIVLNDESACVTEVIQGKADGFIYDQLTIYRNWQQNQDSTAAIFIPFQKEDQWGIAINKNNPQLLSQVNEFLTSFKSNQGFKELSQKYLATEQESFQELGFDWFFDFD